ncbi:MAG: UDP-N-acetylglucosamine 1-carboxyvinyltransferase, partial [Cyclobacteriaceae bacterium]
MGSFRVRGSKRLSGEITPQGAKNEALQVISAVLLTDKTVYIHKIPNIRDVIKLIELLSDLGVTTEKTGPESYKFTAQHVNIDFLETVAFKEQASSLRGSIMILGPLLARFGVGKMPKPGGDKIGRRRVDTHFIGFQKLGATFHYDAGNSFYTVDGSNLKGAYMHLDEASVTG